MTQHWTCAQYRSRRLVPTAAALAHQQSSPAASGEAQPKLPSRLRNAQLPACPSRPLTWRRSPAASGTTPRVTVTAARPQLLEPPLATTCTSPPARRSPIGRSAQEPAPRSPARVAAARGSDGRGQGAAGRAGTAAAQHRAPLLPVLVHFRPINNGHGRSMVRFWTKPASNNHLFLVKEQAVLLLAQ